MQIFRQYKSLHVEYTDICVCLSTCVKILSATMSGSWQQLHLSFLDQQPHIRVYARLFLFFPFPNLEHAVFAIDALRRGLVATLHKLPYLAGSISLPDPSKGHLQVIYNGDTVDVDISTIFSATLEAAHNSQYDYNELVADGFSSLQLPMDVFCPETLQYHPALDDGDPFAERMTTFSKGLPLPVFAAQATFIPGGIVLSMWQHHSVADGIGLMRLYEKWSQAVRTSGNNHINELGFGSRELESLPQKFVSNDEDSMLRQAFESMAQSIQAFPSVKNPDPGASPLRHASYKVTTKVFRFSLATILSLRAFLSNAAQSRVTGFVALAALIWAHVTHVRIGLLETRGYPKTTLSVVVDLRQYLGSPYNSPDYKGNLVLCAKPTITLPISSCSMPSSSLTKEHIAQIAIKISKSLLAIDQNWITARLAQLVSNPSSSENSELRFSNGPDLYITSWQHIGADCQWDIPAVTSSKPAAIRRAAWVSEGGITILPRQREGSAPYEVQISLAEDDMMGFEEALRRGGWLMDRT